MLMTRIIAIRHGETDWNASARIQGQLDIPLNEKGRWQASRTAQALSAGEDIAAIYSSDLSRALDTAAAIGAALSLPVVLEQRLRERGFGEYEGNTFDQLELQWPQQTARWRARDVRWAPPGGETLTDLDQRVQAVTRSIAERHLGAQIVLVAHGGVLDMLYRLATRQTVDLPRTWTLGNASINRLLWTREGLNLVGWSDTRHLEQNTRDEAFT